MAGEAVTPAAHHLFMVDPSAEPLDDPTSILFHHITAKLLFLC